MKPDKIKAELRRRVSYYLQEYIDESEHQDGEEYWKNFNKIDDALMDFGRYLLGVEPKADKAEQAEDEEKKDPAWKVHYKLADGTIGYKRIEAPTIQHAKVHATRQGIELFTITQIEQTT
jgi:hypothetical protein